MQTKSQAKETRQLEWSGGVSEWSSGACGVKLWQTKTFIVCEGQGLPEGQATR